MIAGVPLPPDGLTVLAALLRLHPDVSPDLLSPALRAAVAAIDAASIDDLARAVARRTPAGTPPAPPGRSPASRFTRRWHRRWRVAQALEPVPPLAPGPDAAARLADRLARTADAAVRRDLVAQAPLTVAAQATGARP